MANVAVAIYRLRPIQKIKRNLIQIPFIFFDLMWIHIIY